MDETLTLQELLAHQTSHVSIPLLALNFGLAAVLSWLLGRAYVRFGTGFSNRAQFSRNLLVIAMTTMLIISIIRSSLALSIGLAGALSIIRFRAAIKEPEELSYVFLSIALGVGLGAERTLITTVGFLVIMLILALRHVVRRAKRQPNFHLTVTAPGSQEGMGVGKITEALKAHASAVALQRLDESSDQVQAGFLVQFDDASARLDACSEQLRGLGEGVRVSYVEQLDAGV